MTTTARAVCLLAAVMAVGAITLPRQLPLLAATLGGPGAPPHAALLEAGLRRLLLADRLVPPPTPVLAAFIVWVFAGPFLPDGPAARRALVALLVAGLTPLVALRLGEAAVVWLTPAAAVPRPGDVIGLPRHFVTGPALFVSRDAVRAGLDLLDARLNLVTLSIVVWWAVGLRRLDGEPALWQVAVPLAALVAAGLLTWWLGAPVLLMLLGRP